MSMLSDSLLLPPALLYGTAMQLRNAIFELGWREAIDVGVPVLSIGNLTAGGTGKTPVTAMLLEEFSKRGRRVGVVSRGYGGTERGPARVPSNGVRETAIQFGDEPAWLANRFPETPVVVCGDRVAAVREVLSETQVDLILADDAFQHRRLRRICDVVLFDASAPLWQYRLLPLGRLREPFVSLSRANAVFFTKTNLAPSENLQWLRARIASEAPELPVYELESRIHSLALLNGGKVVPSAELRGRKALLVSGIANPESFAKLVASDVGIKAEHCAFKDHHVFTESDVQQIEAKAKSDGCELIVATEKDAAKLSAFSFQLPVWITKLETVPKTSLTEFYAEADRRLF